MPLENKIKLTSDVDDILAVSQLNKLRKVLPEKAKKTFQKLGEYYVSQVHVGVFHSDDFEQYCRGTLKKTASENNIDLNLVLKNLPQAAWLFITRHRPDLLEDIASSHETRHAVVADVIAGFFGCPG